MNGLLRGLLVALVLLNLAFVQITEGASWTWLGPLVLVTVASPLLIPFRGNLFYRLLWNGVVLAVFAMLVHHATSGGVPYLLEDGLLLAALCQVHLLNNIGADQKPDLLFFNSFLIAVVTSFLSIDLAYFILFLAYAPVLTAGLMVHTLVSKSQPGGRGALRPMAFDGIYRSVLLLGLSLLMFFVVPRDFTRRGLLGDRLSFQPGSFLGVGFSDEVNLERAGGRAKLSDRIIMTVTRKEDDEAGISSYWRGATLYRFNGAEWPSNFDRWTPGERRWEERAHGWERPSMPPGPVVAVEVRDRNVMRLFSPLRARRLVVRDPEFREKIQPLPDFTFLLHGPGRDRGRIRYELMLSAAPPRLGGRVGSRPSPRHLVVDRSLIPDELVRFADRLRAEVPTRAPQFQIVEKFRSAVEARYRYLLPGEEGSAANLEEFVAGKGGGHCEFFATTLALMLRLKGVPARLATGFRSEEWDAEGRVLTIRSRHAHAWVEVLDPSGGWYTVDATPPGGAADAPGRGLLSRIGGFLGDVWNQVTGFNAKNRAAALAWLAAVPGRVVRSVNDNLGGALAVVALLFGWLFARRRRVGPESVRTYLAAVRRSRIPLRPGETPREFLARARRQAIPPRRFDRLRLATERHEAARYRVLAEV